MERATYFLAFTTCGTPPIDGEAGAPTRVAQRPLEFDEVMRNAVADCIVEVCGWNGWELSVVNVLADRVHVVLSAERKPEYVMTELKAWATRRLRETGFVVGKDPVWNRNGSIRYVPAEEQRARIVADAGGKSGDHAVGVRFGVVDE